MADAGTGLMMIVDHHHWSNLNWQILRGLLQRALSEGSKSVCLHREAPHTHPPPEYCCNHLNLNWRRRSVPSVFTVHHHHLFTIATVRCPWHTDALLQSCICSNERRHFSFLYLFIGRNQNRSCCSTGKQKVCASRKSKFPWTLPKFHPKSLSFVFTRFVPSNQLPSPSAKTCHPRADWRKAPHQPNQGSHWTEINWI